MSGAERWSEGSLTPAFVRRGWSKSGSNYRTHLRSATSVAVVPVCIQTYIVRRLRTHISMFFLCALRVLRLMSRVSSKFRVRQRQGSTVVQFDLVAVSALYYKVHYVRKLRRHFPCANRRVSRCRALITHTRIRVLAPSAKPRDGLARNGKNNVAAAAGLRFRKRTALRNTWFSHNRQGASPALPP